VRRLSATFFAAVILAGCGIQDPYPLPDEPPGAATFHPISVGETVTETVLFIEEHADTRLELLAAEPIGQLDGVTVAFYAAPLTVDAAGDVVIGEPLEDLAGTRLEDLADASAEPPEDTVGIVAEMTASEPGRYVLTAVRLSYRINGAERGGEGIDVVVTVCADEPAPTDCE
jgi:hypothetical protein